MLKAGLFSALGAVSVVESYKWLLPDSGDETVGLLVQISQQLANNSQQTASIEPFKRTVPDIMANFLWFTSVAICIGSAIFATLIQQWARRYLALAQGPGTPEKCAAARKYLEDGIKKFWMPQVCQLLSMALHVSIALYSLGFIFFVFHVDKGWVPFVVLVYPPVFLTYLILTVLPIFSVNCPYGTPFTALVWCVWHFGLFVTFSSISRFANLLCLSSLKESLQDGAEDHWELASKGLKEGIDRKIDRYSNQHTAEGSHVAGSDKV